MDPSRTSAQSGFSLLAAGVLIAILLIAALALAPVAGRQLDAQRTAQTQRALPAAFRGIFPYPLGTPGADLRTDFGYAPAAPSAFLWAGDQTPSWDLLALTSRLAVGVSDAAHNPPAAFDGTNAGSAWNGPYWTGSVDGGMRPVDGWGRPFQLRYVTSPSAGWILFSAGANGVDNTASASGTPGGDDLIYPQPPYVPPTTASAFPWQMSLTLLLQSHIPADPCYGANNVTLSVTVEDAAGVWVPVTDALSPSPYASVAATGLSLHRNGSGRPNQILFRFLGVQPLRPAPGQPGILKIRIVGGCPDAGTSQPYPTTLLQDALGTTYIYQIPYQDSSPLALTLRP